MPTDKLQTEMMKTAAAASAEAQAMKPVDAATLIIVDTDEGAPRVLMGKRRGDLAFMPNKFVFPGGRVDATDKGLDLASDLRPSEVAKLLVDMKGAPSAGRARALGLAALREAFEEAGLVIGERGPATGDIPEAWQAYTSLGYRPTLEPLTLIARAITPPGRPRRFDTRFFATTAKAIAERRPIADGELSGLEWVTLEAARGLDLPNITRVVLEDLEQRITHGLLDASAEPVPFYYMRGGSFHRDLIRAP